MSAFPSLDQPFVSGFLETPIGKAPQVSFRLGFRDRFGAFKARWGVGRMNYQVDPGLYALGEPDGRTPVLVTANYKMSFDSLRESVPDRNAWILALDTKGINVWCAAGKGTFGTKELVGRIASSGLEKIVSQRDLIIPQLGAPGVAAHQVQKTTGFKVHYGPIRASDLPAFLDSGLKATPQMRMKTFTLWERIVLIPIELVRALQVTVFVIPAFFIIGGFSGTGGFWSNALHNGIFPAAAFMAAVIAGTVLFPMLLPLLPGRAFSLKGFILGATVALIAVSGELSLPFGARFLAALSWFLLISSLTAYLAMNFTGASTYTSLSGVKKEMRWAVPTEAFTALAGIIFWLCSLFVV